MTGRQLIEKIIQSVGDLDIPLELILTTKDENCCLSRRIKLLDIRPSYCSIRVDVFEKDLL